MGMSDDLDVAIEAGSTMVRNGVRPGSPPRVEPVDLRPGSRSRSGVAVPHRASVPPGLTPTLRGRGARMSNFAKNARSWLGLEQDPYHDAEYADPRSTTSGRTTWTTGSSTCRPTAAAPPSLSAAAPRRSANGGAGTVRSVPTRPPMRATVTVGP